MARIINLTESDLNRIIRRVMNESNEIQKIDTGLLSKLSEFAKNLSTELGQDIDVETIQDTAVCTIDEIQPETQIGEKESGVLQQVKSKIMTMVNRGGIAELKAAFKLFKNKLNENSSITEQAAVALLPFTLLGVTAPISVWIAIGVVVLALIIWGIVKLASWIPKSSGHGCSRKVTKRVRY